MRHLVLFASMACALAGTRGVARAANAPIAPVALTYDAPSAGCPSAESFRESVQQRRPGGTVVLGGEGTAALNARIELRAGDRNEARAKVSVLSGERIVAEREVRGRSCAEVAQASALFVAVFADREDASAAEESTETEESEVEGSTPPPASAPANAPANVRAVAPVNRDATALGIEEPKAFAIEANPLSLLVRRASVQIEWLPAVHHALVVNPFFFHSKRKHTADGVAYDVGTQNGAGAEIGYRYYTGRHGPNGFFIGPSLVLASFWKTGGEPRPYEAIVPAVEAADYRAFGPAIDLGGQILVGPGVLLGFGGGVQYLFTSGRPGTGDLSSIFEGRTGFSPRVLASIGYAF